MNPNINKLYKIANKQKRTIVGLMSGTSLDGLDIALCNFEGSGLNCLINLLEFETIPYSKEFKNEIQSIFSKKEIDLEKLTVLNAWIAIQHAKMINGCLQKWKIKNEEVDLVASHGQTIYHAPKHLQKQKQYVNASLQIGDGDHLAVSTGIITISDFRQKHIASGGEGAPLAVYGDFLLFSKPGIDRLLLNIGGIANFTLLPASMDTSKIFSTDTGPGNTIMDSFVQKNFKGKNFDEDGYLASKGSINDKLLTTLKNNVFFTQPFPKTTGPELFNLTYLQTALKEAGILSISNEEVMATLNKFTADTIVLAVQKAIAPNEAVEVYTSGGGVHNKILMQHLTGQLSNFKFYDTSILNINPDAKEAMLFALLANECVCGNAAVYGKGTIGMPAITMGKISFPA